jgi:glycosyltransferase involved in cell wall biosynthesis
VPELTPEPGLDIRKQFGISKDRKLFLHIGSLLKRKGTLDILDAFLFLSPDETARFALLIVGKASPEMDTLIRSKIEMLNNLQPATCNLQPATCIRYLNEFLSPEVFKSCIDQSDLVLVPYRYAESSSGVAGHAFAAGKPLLGVRKGLLGEMVAEYGSGIFIDEYGPASIAKGIKRALTAELTGKTSLRFLQMHSKEAFAAKIIASIPR